VTTEIVQDNDVAWPECWGEHLFDIDEEMSPFMVPSTTSGAVTPPVRNPATNVDVFQCPCGTAAAAGSRGARPYRRVMLVVAQEVNTKRLIRNKHDNSAQAPSPTRT
jgi:hypothetical protein